MRRLKKSKFKFRGKVISVVLSTSIIKKDEVVSADYDPFIDIYKIGHSIVFGIFEMTPNPNDPEIELGYFTINNLGAKKRSSQFEYEVNSCKAFIGVIDTICFGRNVDRRLVVSNVLSYLEKANTTAH